MKFVLHGPEEEDINSPVSWCCVDCGVNTSPGMMTRAEIYKHFVIEGKENVEQSVTWDSEVYEVRDVIWSKAGMGPSNGCLCIGCLEKRIGRRLKSKDFKRDDAFNSPLLPASKRLRDRRGHS